MRLLQCCLILAAAFLIDQFATSPFAAAQTATDTNPEPQKQTGGATTPPATANADAAKPDATKAEPAAPDEPNLAKTAKITCSDKKPGRNKSAPLTVNGAKAKDGREPKSSHDNSPLSHFDWWPDRDVTEWCEYTWEQPVSISQTQLYWWDDSKHNGGCKVPVSWKAFYKEGEDWKPVETKDTLGVEEDKYNKVNFKPVETRALRLEIVVPKDGSVGIQEWKVR